MKTIRLLITLLTGSASAVFAATETQGEGMGILIYMFVGFFALVIVAQLVPAIFVFYGMLRGLLKRPEKEAVKSDS